MDTAVQQCHHMKAQGQLELAGRNFIDTGSTTNFIAELGERMKNVTKERHVLFCIDYIRGAYSYVYKSPTKHPGDKTHNRRSYLWCLQYSAP